MRIAYFVSPHGFGHAARASAVIEAMTALDPGVRAEIFTTVPRWFFDDSLSAPFGWHQLACDVGLMQHSALEVDLPGTVGALEELDAAFDRRVEQAVAALDRLGVERVVADIAPLGIVSGRRARLPTALVENFTWEWIYDGYLEAEPRLGPFRDRFAAIDETVDLWIQTTPGCGERERAVVVPPVSRAARTEREEVRRRLRIEDDRPAILLTMGGIAWRYDFVEHLADREEWVFVVPGAIEGERGELVVDRNLRLMPHHSAFFHPDLVHAVDVVIGKLGYSTVAEATTAGRRFGFVERPDFVESEVLARFVEDAVPSFRMAPGEFERCSWLERLAPLLEQEEPGGRNVDGAQQTAARILGMAQSISDG